MSSHRNLILAVFVIAAAIVSGCAFSPDSGGRKLGHETTVYVDTLPTCPSCTLKLEPVAVLGSKTDSFLFRDFPTIEQDSRGMYYALDDQRILAFDKQGRFLGEVGKKGGGPGEFGRVLDMHAGTADSLYLIHDRAMSVFNQKRQFVRTVLFEKPWALSLATIADVRPEGVIISQMITPSFAADSSAAPLTLYDNSGRKVRSFGPRGLTWDNRVENGLRGPCCMRQVALAANGGFWLADIGYRLERIDAYGLIDRVIGVEMPSSWRAKLIMNSREMELERERHMMDAKSRPPEPRRDPNATKTRLNSRPPATRTGMWQMNDTLLVVVTRDGIENWRDIIGIIDTARSDEGHTQFQIGYADSWYDTIVDIVNISSGDLVVRQRFNGKYLITSNGTFYIRSVDQDGLIKVKTYSLSWS
jgi:hypothetical protein